MTNQSAFSIKQLPKSAMGGLFSAIALLPFALAFGAASPIGIGASLLTMVAAGILSSLILKSPLGINVPTCGVFLLFSAACAQLGLGAALTAGLLSGLLVFALSFFKLEKLRSAIPAPLVLGFFAGITVVMGILQTNVYFGIKASGTTALQMLESYTRVGFHCNWRTMLYGTIVLVVMITYPRTFKKFSKLVPSSFVGIAAALLLNLWLIPNAASSPVAEIGSVAKDLLPRAGMWLDLPARTMYPTFFLYVFALAGLLLASSILVHNKHTDARQTATDQGLSNIFLSCIGGMPTASAKQDIGRGIPYAGVFQSIFLLTFVLLFGKPLLRIPISALAVVLIFTAFQQVDWAAVKLLFQSRSKLPALAFLTAAAATVLLPLPAAITCFGVVCAINATVKVLKTKKMPVPKLGTSDSPETL